MVATSSYTRLRSLACRFYVLSSSTSRSFGIFHLVTPFSSSLGMSTMSTSTAKAGVVNQQVHRIAVGQMQSTGNKIQNLLTMAGLASRAQEQGACMLLLPENCGFMGKNALETLENAENYIHNVDSDGDTGSATLDKSLPTNLQDALKEAMTMNKSTNDVVSDLEDYNNIEVPSHSISLIDGLSFIAQTTGLWLSVGGVHVRSTTETDRIYNTHLIVNSNGAVVAMYRKIHLFDVEIPGKVTLRESATTAPGQSIVTCDSPIGLLGLSTCYDVRFPELYVELVKRGAQVLLVPAAFTVPTGKAHWHTLLKARAIESQCFVIAAAQYGIHNEKRESYGHSLVVNPWGEVLADAGGADTLSSNTAQITDLIVCDIDLDLISSVRRNMPIQQHRSAANYK